MEEGVRKMEGGGGEICYLFISEVVIFRDFRMI